MCRKPFGSGGKRVVTGRPKRPVATSSSTSSRMKLLRGVVSLDTDSGGEGLREYKRSASCARRGSLQLKARDLRSAYVQRPRGVDPLEPGPSAHSLPFHDVVTWRADMLTKRRKWIGVLLLAAWVGS